MPVPVTAPVDPSGEHVFYALPPFEREPMRVEHGAIRALSPDGSLAPGDGTPTRFEDVDADAWMRRFVEALDRFVQTPVPAPDAEGADEVVAAMTRTFDCLFDMAPLLADRLEPVLLRDFARWSPPNASPASLEVRARRATAQVRLPDAPPFGALPQVPSDPFEAARSLLTERLRARLSDAYAVGVIVQHAGAGVGEPPVETVFVPVASPSRHAGVPWTAELARRAPVACRAVPRPTAIRRQEAVPTHPQAASLAEVAAWTYVLEIAPDGAAQDRITIHVHQGPPHAPHAEPPPPSIAHLPTRAGAWPGRRELYTTLAQYVVVADAVDALLQPLAAGAIEGSVPATARRAATTFAELAERVVGAFAAADTSAESRSRVAALQSTRETPSARLELRLLYGDDDGTVSAIVASRPELRAEGAFPWPSIDMWSSGVTPVAFDSTAPADGAATYRPSAALRIPPGEHPVIQLSWPGLHVAHWPSAQASVQVTRNERLLVDADHPEDAGPATSDRFVYEGSAVEAPDPVRVLLDRGHAPIRLTGATLLAALESAMAALLPTDREREALELTAILAYSHALAPTPASVPGDDVLRSSIPVVLADRLVASRLAQSLSDRATAWLNATRPPRDKGRWELALTLQSAGSDSVPLLQVMLHYDEPAAP